MKRLILSIILNCLVLVAITANYRDVEISDNRIILEFGFETVKFTEDIQHPGKSRISIQGFVENDEPGFPAIPQRVESFILPEGKNNVNVTYECELDTVPIDISAASTSIESIDGKYANLDMPINPYSDIWPNDCANVIKTGIYRDIHTCYVKITPVRYDYTNKLAIIARKLKIILELSTQPDLSSVYKKRTSSIQPTTHKLDYTLLPNLFTITSDIEENEEDNSNNGRMKAIVLPDYRPTKTAPSLLIICPDIAKGDAERLAAWKRRMGFNVNVESQSVSYLSNPDNVYNIILKHYDEEEYLQYVLLFGNGNYIRPWEGKYPSKAWNPEIQKFETLDYYTDFYYSCMDGENDTIEDLIIGRLPARTKEEFGIMVDNIISYEKSTFVLNSGEENNKSAYSLLISEYGGEGTTDQYNFIPTLEKMHESKSDKYYIDSDRLYYAASKADPEYWNSGSVLGNVSIDDKLRKPRFNWSITPYDIINGFNAGYHTVFYRGHGNVGLWGHLRFYSTDAENLRNSYRPAVFAITCLSGMFYHPVLYPNSTTSAPAYKSMAEVMLGRKNGGAIGYVGANRETWFGYNEYFALGLFDAMYPNKNLSVKIPGRDNVNGARNDDYLNRLGDIFLAGCSWMFKGYGDREYSTSDKKLRYNREVYHCLGDPTLRIRTFDTHEGRLQWRWENGKRIYLDSSPLVLVSKSTNYVFTMPNPFGIDIDQYTDGYYVTCFLDGCAPILLEDYDFSQNGLTNSNILKITRNSQYLNIDYCCNSDNVLFKLFDIYGNLISSSKGSEGVATLKACNTMGVVTMTEDGAVTDSMVISPSNR